MVDVNPEDAKIVGDLIGGATNAFSDKLLSVTSWITDFIGGLGWFEWSIIVGIIALILLYIILSRKVDELKNMSRSKFYSRRRFK